MSIKRRCERRPNGRWVFTGRESVRPEAELDDKRLSVAKSLLHAVAYSEDLLQGTDLGIPQGPVGTDLPGLAQRTWWDMDDAAKAISGVPNTQDIFGPQTRQIYENIATRLNKNPVLAHNNRPVGMKEFPPFPQSK